MDLKELTNEQLRLILVTCDGNGKDVKFDALEELELRAFVRGVEEGSGSN